MKEENFWQKYSEFSAAKAERRGRKKRKRMPVQGKSVFKILKQKTKGV